MKDNWLIPAIITPLLNQFLLFFSTQLFRMSWWKKRRELKSFAAHCGIWIVNGMSNSIKQWWVSEPAMNKWIMNLFVNELSEWGRSCEWWNWCWAAFLLVGYDRCSGMGLRQKEENAAKQHQLIHEQQRQRNQINLFNLFEWSWRKEREWSNKRNLSGNQQLVVGGADWVWLRNGGAVRCPKRAEFAEWLKRMKQMKRLRLSSFTQKQIQEFLFSFRNEWRN